MKVTDAHLSLVSYHIQEKEKVIPEVYRPETEKELLDILRLGTPYEPVFSLIEYKSKPPANLQVSYYNTVYLCTKEVDSWRELGKEWLEVLELHPELYKHRLDQFKRLFDFEAYDYLWDNYKNYPKKLLSEVIKIALSNPNRKQTIEDLGVKNQKEVNVFLDICINLGNLDYSKTLFELPESSLRQLFIGSDKKPPYIYYFLVGNKRKVGSNPELWQAVEILKEAVDSKLIPLNIGAVLFNQWVNSLKKVQLNYKKYQYQFDYKKLNKLENLLKGI
jgi:hypothetical protein